MSTLVLDRSNLEICVDGAALALYESGERRGTVPLNLLQRVIIQGNVRLESSVLTRLAEQGVAAVILSRRQSRAVAFVLGSAHADASVRLAQCRLAFDDAWCDEWSRRLMMRKIRAQHRFLRLALESRPDCRKPLTDALASLESMSATLRACSGMESRRVRGLEGAAAAACFGAMTSLFADSLNFTGRNRRPPRDPVNACLSLGYTLLHFDAVRACHTAGLDPLVGFFHRPAFGRESMACDLVEPLRPRIDQWVWNLFRERTLRPENFAHDKGACLLNKAGRARFYEEYEVFSPAVRRRLRRDCMVLVRVLRRRGEPFLEQADDFESED